MSESDFLLAPGEQAPQASSEFQRFRIHVPNVKTTVSLGASADGGGIREADTGAPNFAGFGVNTEGHVFITAGGKTPADNKVKIQSLGEITMLTESSFMLGSKSSALIHTPQNVMLSGDDGVFIAGGTFLPSDVIQMPDGARGASPAAPAYVAQVANAVSFVSKMWTNVDAAFAGFEIACAAHDLVCGVREAKGWKKLAAAVRPIFNAYVANWGGNVSGAVGIGDHPVTFGAKGSTVIHGESGLILGSMGSAGLYSALGTTLGSLIGVGMTAPTTSVQGFLEVSVKSPKGGVSVSAGKQVEVLANKGVEIAARHGNTLIRGKQVVLGSKGGGDKQEETKFLGGYGITIGYYAGKAVRLIGGESAALRAEKTMVGGDVTAIDGDTALGLTGKAISVSAGDKVSVGTPKFGFCATTSKLTIGNVAKELPAEPSWQNPREAEALKALGSDTPMQDMAEFMPEINKARQEYEDKWYEWVKKCDELTAKDALIEFTDSQITMKIKQAKLELDSSKLNVLGNLAVQK